MALVSCSGGKSQMDRFIDDLMGKMTVEEKIGQLNLPVAGDIVTGQAKSSNVSERIRKGEVGGLFNLKGADKIREVQRIAVEESRLGIPIIISRDVIHGFKTMFPIPLGLAATFDPELVQQGARVAAIEATASGIRWTFSPMLDIARDPRWGRIAEGSGEDTYLDAQMGVAMVKGYQGETIDETSMAACVKHFVAYGAAEGGRDYNSTGITERTLRNVYLPPFEACVKAGAMTLMTSFNDNDGVPSTGNGFLVNDVLRGEWGFDGFVVSDWASIYEMVNHGFAEDNKHAGELAINAGVDMDMMSYAYISHIEELINEGKVSIETIDTAVRNILRIKVRLGLFENPYVDESKTEAAFYSPEALEAARKSAVESAVLLTNNGVLPLNKAKVKTVLVTGPMADAPHDQLGTWTFDGDPAHTVTPLKAIRQLYGNDVQVIYEPGLKFTREFDKGGIAKAVKAAKKADVILAFMGEEAIMSGEAHCLTDITLKGDQRAMIEALKATGKPLVLNIIAGRPLELDFEIANSDAILYSFHPGTMGGPAIAQLIFGDETPSGKTPITFPKNVGQIPIYYNHNMTGRPYNGTETMLYDIPLRAGQTSLGNTSYWLDATFEPEFPFGYGLTYTTFEYGKTVVAEAVVGENDVLKVKATLKNTGKKEATEVVQLYVRDLVGSVTRPVRELKGFQRVTLAPGQQTEVVFELPIQDLAFYGKDMVKKVEPGKFQVWIAGDSASGTLAEFEVK